MIRLLIPVCNFVFHDDVIRKSDIDVFLPEIWALKVLKTLMQKCPVMTSVNRNFDSDFAKKGDTVTIPIIGTFVVNDKVSGDPVTLQRPTGNDTIDIILTDHKEVSFLIEDIALANSNVNVYDEYVESAAKALGEYIEAAVANEYANAGSIISIATEGGLEEAMIACRTAVVVDGLAPEDNQRSCIVRDYAEFIGEADFVSKDTLGQSTMETGQVGTILGFKVKEAGLLPNSGLLHRMAFHKDAIVLATRTLKVPPEALGIKSAIINMNGVGLRCIVGYNMNYLGLQVTMDICFGVKTIRPEWVVDLVD